MVPAERAVMLLRVSPAMRASPRGVQGCQLQRPPTPSTSPTSSPQLPLQGTMTGRNVLLGALQEMQEEVARRIVPAERAVLLLSVSRTMREAIKRLRPAARVKVKAKGGQTIERVEGGLPTMSLWLLVTTLDLSFRSIEDEGAGRLAAMLGQSRLFRTAIPRTAPGAKLCLNVASINPPHQLDHPSKMSVRPPRLNFSPPPPRSSKSAEARRVGVLVMPSDAFLCRFLRGGGPPSNPRALACLVPRDSKLAFLLRSLIELSPPPPPP